MAPIVSVVVVTKNEERHIANCLESLVRQDYPSDKYEVIVVDAGSTDRTQEIAGKYPVKLIIDDYGTLGHQRNTAIENSHGKYVVFTDADCIADVSWLTRLTTAISSSPPDIVAVGGPNLIMDDDPAFSRVVGYMQETFLGSGGSPQAYKISEPKWNVISIPNCNAIYKKEIIAKEKYDNSLGIGEDCELNYRLKRKGYRFAYMSDAIVWHHRPSNFREFVNKMFVYGRFNAVITKKHKAVVRWYDFVPLLAILALILAYPVIRLLPWMLYPYITALLIYLLALLFSTLQVSLIFKGSHSVLTMVLLPVQHFIYGFGFIRGLLGRA